MGAGIAASPHCAERRICRCSQPGYPRKHQSCPRSWLTSSGVASHLTTPSEEETDRLPDCATRGFACLPTIGAWQSQSHPMFRGPSWVNHSSVSLCPSTRRLPNRVALEEDQLFRRLFPTDPEKLRRASHCLSAEIGPSVTLRFPSCRCRPSGGGGDFRPDHLLTMHPASESGKQIIRSQACG